MHSTPAASPHRSTTAAKLTGQVGHTVLENVASWRLRYTPHIDRVTSLQTAPRWRDLPGADFLYDEPPPRECHRRGISAPQHVAPCSEILSAHLAGPLPVNAACRISPGSSWQARHFGATSDRQGDVCQCAATVATHHTRMTSHTASQSRLAPHHHSALDGQILDLVPGE